MSLWILPPLTPWRSAEGFCLMISCLFWETFARSWSVCWLFSYGFLNVCLMIFGFYSWVGLPLFAHVCQRVDSFQHVLRIVTFYWALFGSLWPCQTPSPSSQLSFWPRNGTSRKEKVKGALRPTDFWAFLVVTLNNEIDGIWGFTNFGPKLSPKYPSNSKQLSHPILKIMTYIPQEPCMVYMLTFGVYWW